MSEFHITRTLPEDAMAAALRADVLKGLTSDPKTLPPKWFYDAHGSELFERITELPEYYPTRAEREILAGRATEIAAALPARTLVELGSGSSEKTRLLLDALPRLHTYVPVDVSDSALEQAGRALVAERPGLNVHALIADFTAGLTLPPPPARGWWRSSAARSGTCCPANALSSWPRCAPCSPPATRCCSAPIWSRPRTYWSGRTTTRPG